MPLTDTQIKGLRPSQSPTKHSDGGGLHLLVSPAGGKLWRLSYRHGGKQKTLALGAYPIVSLADARLKRTGAKQLLANGIDPAQQAKTDRAAKLASNANTFAAIADEFLAKAEREGKAEACRSRPTCRVSGRARCAHQEPQDVHDVFLSCRRGY
ncbi:MAG: Arm DNA-binding domain-containing protein [Aquamicrobium sp.]|uniref:Arm DNA-binding domain-containing protein n=1 Tax=Aquamicrobium sp. TaxID=1872579 RepID=UPI00349E83A8|nr:Arm DNA-binding domain-containing protein [Aquamicrobium sp.]